MEFFAPLQLDQWAYERGVQLCFIEPGRPAQNAWIDSFNGRLQDECLNEHWFLRHPCACGPPTPMNMVYFRQSVADARQIIEAWRIDYNRQRPQSALGYQTPEELNEAATRSQTQPRRLIGLS